MLEHKYAFEALGTPWVIETANEIPALVKSRIGARIELFDAQYSRFRNDSLVTAISKKAGTYAFTEDAVKLFDFYKDLYRRTDGKVTPLIGDVLARAGYDAKYSFTRTPQKELVALDEAMEWNGSKVHTLQPITLDVGAAGKGYLVDIIAAILDGAGIDEYVIDASGDLRHTGASNNMVGLEHPLDPTKVIGSVQVQNKSLCASASNRRAWGEDMHHIFDPDTMAPTREVIATWVIADEAMVADGLATALFFVDVAQLRDGYEFEYVRMFADGAIDYSPHFEGELF